jgi:hypothetical protein
MTLATSTGPNTLLLRLVAPACSGFAPVLIKMGLVTLISSATGLDLPGLPLWLRKGASGRSIGSSRHMSAPPSVSEL